MSGCAWGETNYWGWSVGSALIKVLMLFTEGHRFHHPPLPLIFYSVFSLYPHFVSYCKYRISSYNYWRWGSIDLEKGNSFITCVWCGVVCMVWCEWCMVCVCKAVLSFSSHQGAVSELCPWLEDYLWSARRLGTQIKLLLLMMMMMMMMWEDAVM